MENREGVAPSTTVLQTAFTSCVSGSDRNLLGQWLIEGGMIQVAMEQETGVEPAWYTLATCCLTGRPLLH